MTSDTIALHPWVSTSEAVKAAENAVQIPMVLMPTRAKRVEIVTPGWLHSQALVILGECALPPREVQRTLCAACGGPLAAVRKDAKFCSTACSARHATRGRTGVPSSPQAHVGAMWTWPEDEREKWAVREIGYVLCNHVRTRRDLALPADAYMNAIHRKHRLAAQLAADEEIARTLPDINARIRRGEVLPDVAA